MNEQLIGDLFAEAQRQMTDSSSREFSQKFAEKIVRECMRMCDVAAVGYDTHNHIKEANGCCSAKEYIAEHFRLEQRTPSQKMADAGYTRRPKGWTKEGEE